MGKGMGREEVNDEGYGKWVELADLPTPHHPRNSDLFLRKSYVLTLRVMNLGREASPS